VDLKGKRFLVIGGAGFVGSHVVDQLLKEDVKEVIIYDNFFRGRMDSVDQALTDPRCKIFAHGGDVSQVDILNKAMEGIDGVFHLAALWILQCHEYPRTAFDVNVQGTFNVIEAVIKNNVKRIVFSSSASVYGDALELPMTEDHPYNNVTFYGASKIAGEHFLKSLGDRYKFEWVGLRYMNVYGPRQDYSGAYVAVMHKILDCIDKGQNPKVYGDGSQQYDFISVEDIARSNILAMKAEKSGEFYNVGRGIGTSIKELAELLLKLTGSSLKIEFMPQGLTFVSNRVGCTKKASKDLGFDWRIDLAEGMKSLIQWRKNDIQALNDRRNNIKGVTHDPTSNRVSSPL
jgi:UDP-glucose 4-epimerase